MNKNADKIIATAVPLWSVGGGTFADGHEFIEWIAKSGQNAWVMLPLNESQLEEGSSTKHVPSPYKGYGIGLDPRYLSTKLTTPDAQWIKENAYWLDTYALFCALRDHFGTDDWRKWDEDIRGYTPHGITTWTKKLARSIRHYKEQQSTLHAEYKKLKAKARDTHVLLVGDIPYYMSLQSPLVWSHQGLFEIRKDGKLLKVSGSLGGSKTQYKRRVERQVWGHPLYKWGFLNHRTNQITGLFKLRMRYHAELFDMIRMDYAKAFFTYTSIDLRDERHDRFRSGPGERIVAQLALYARKLKLALYMEDTGNYVKELRKTMEKYSLPGIKIFRYAYTEKRHHLYEGYADIMHFPFNTVAYTTTHDSETLMGYLALLSKDEKNLLAKYVGVGYTDDESFAHSIHRAFVASAAHMIVIPIQDWLLTKDRINIPGTEREIGDPNWRYRLNIPIADLPTKLW